MSAAMNIRVVWSVLVVLALGPVAGSRAQDRVSETVHNLSVSGPGRVRAQGETQVCIFCHAPHNTGGVRPLWNRELPVTNYRIYQSSTLDARPGQPTGSSKLCLSCHDGTIALGNVLSRGDRIRMSSGEFMPSGLCNLGTDLSDDHPICFSYTGGLAASDQQLQDPGALREEIKLDAMGQVHCTSCHDPHYNRYGDFLVLPDAYGELCIACHSMEGWTGSAHQVATATVAGAVGGDWPYNVVAENACRSCHRAHTAGGRERLLIFEAEEDNCLTCHDGRVARSNILAEIDKSAVHDPRRYTGAHDPREAGAGEQQHVECADCHNPHAVAEASPSIGYVALGPTMQHVRGVTIGGAEVPEARYEYEVCLRCHGDSAVRIARPVMRQAQTDNLRLKFSPGNPSYHPVALSTAGSEVVSLVPGLPIGSMIRCTDCHNSDASPRANGSGPDGPHGSIHDFLLEQNYTVRDVTAESAYEYALCYKCHQRSIVLSNRSFPLHQLHVVDERTPCSACHDPHGISPTVAMGSDHTHLINFDTEIVRPVGVNRLAFRDTGSRSGSCTLVCHGITHEEWSYDMSGATSPGGMPSSGTMRRR